MTWAYRLMTAVNGHGKQDELHASCTHSAPLVHAYQFCLGYLPSSAHSCMVGRSVRPAVRSPMASVIAVG